MSIRLLEHMRDELIATGIVQNTPEFCRSWLGRSEGYIRVLRYHNTEPSVETLSICSSKLGHYGARLAGSEQHEHQVWAKRLSDLKALCDGAIGYFDTAPWYGFGRSERVMGDTLRGTNYALSDKVGRLLKPGAVKNPMDYGMIDPLPFHVVYDYSYDGIMRAFEDNLQRLGLDRI